MGRKSEVKRRGVGRYLASREGSRAGSRVKLHASASQND